VVRAAAVRHRDVELQVRRPLRPPPRHVPPAAATATTQAVAAGVLRARPALAQTVSWPVRDRPLSSPGARRRFDGPGGGRLLRCQGQPQVTVEWRTGRRTACTLRCIAPLLRRAAEADQGGEETAGPL